MPSSPDPSVIRVLLFIRPRWLQRVLGDPCEQRLLICVEFWTRNLHGLRKLARVKAPDLLIIDRRVEPRRAYGRLSLRRGDVEPQHLPSVKIFDGNRYVCVRSRLNPTL